MYYNRIDHSRVQTLDWPVCSETFHRLRTFNATWNGKYDKEEPGVLSRIYQAGMEQHPSPNYSPQFPAVYRLMWKEERMPHSGNFLDMCGKFSSVYYVFCVLLQIKYGSTNYCILLLFTFCTFIANWVNKITRVHNKKAFADYLIIFASMSFTSRPMWGGDIRSPSEQWILHLNF